MVVIGSYLYCQGIFMIIIIHNRHNLNPLDETPGLRDHVHLHNQSSVQVS